MATRRNVTTGKRIVGSPLTTDVTVPALTAGSTVIVELAGVVGHANIGSSGGTAFTKRTTYGGGAFDVSTSDIVAAGGETIVSITANADFGLAWAIYEVDLGVGGGFASWSNNAGGNTANSASDFACLPDSAVTVTGPSLLVGGWIVDSTGFAFNTTNQWRQFGPLGHLYANDGSTGGVDFIWASGLADVDATHSFPASLAAGQYKATSNWFRGAASVMCSQAVYTDNSGVATNAAPTNPIVAENSLPGASRNKWWGAPMTALGVDATIAGYADRCSYAPGDTVAFKVDSTAFAFRVEIYRLGHYGSEEMGARQVAGFITGTIQTQPAATVDSTLGHTKCAWTTNATWTVPAAATPGVYVVLYRRTDDTTKISMGHFIVTGAVTNKMAVVVPDCTYQAYNIWGATTDNGPRAVGGTWTGRSLYQIGGDLGTVNLAHRAYAVSFDRPYGVQATQANTYMWDSDFAAWLFLESQGYDLTYVSDTQLEADPTLLTTAKIVMPIGHHEYTSEAQWNALRGAETAGVNVASVGANMALWHTRFIDAGRTIVCYKDSASIDATPGFDAGTGRDPLGFTGTWRDTRGIYNIDPRPEQLIYGQMFVANAPANKQLEVPFAQKTLPVWRNSAAVQALTTGTVYTTPTAVYGDEGDFIDTRFQHSDNQVTLSPTVVNLSQGSNVNGSLYSTPYTGITIGWSLFRDPSGALVAHTGGWRGWEGVSRWARNEFGSTIATPNIDWQNAVNALLYDLGGRPASIRPTGPGDTALTDPATGAPTGSRDDIAVAYGLTAGATFSGWGIAI